MDSGANGGKKTVILSGVVRDKGENRLKKWHNRDNADLIAF